LGAAALRLPFFLQKFDFGVRVFQSFCTYISESLF
jgi:hypothetical protein